MKIGEAPLLGLAQDFHPLDYAPAERITIKHLRISAKVLYYYIMPICDITKNTPPASFLLRNIHVHQKNRLYLHHNIY